MFRNLVKIFEPIKNHISRTAVGSTVGGAQNGSAFERNSVTKEQQLSEALKRSLPGITFISVEDISGGCGAMFEVSVEAKEFIGLSRVKQHRLVTESLKSEIAEMHGIRIHTTPTPADK
ncbi:bolA-like protein 3 [Trichoplusia ni]|uniref:BolA-like protein 3 n=1 Tax=Trichoplusia ni TaxID=7111 RepID=A0A7E5WYF9_TRINI|nr:bolA-like protein 3 [Trichoplusia ni]